MALPGSFFDRPVLEVAHDLLGAILVHGPVRIRLTEVEAYAGAEDPGSHAHPGRTARNATMFGPPGHLYLYLSYGIHVCANVVTGPVGEPGAVLLRAGEVVAGPEVARERRQRGRRSPVLDRDLARGPGNLARAAGLSLDQDGIAACSPSVPGDPDGEPGGPEVLAGAAGDRPLLLADTGPGGRRVLRGPRVGVSGPGGSGDLFPWRLWLEGEATVSAYRPGGAGRGRRLTQGAAPGGAGHDDRTTKGQDT